MDNYSHQKTLNQTIKLAKDHLQKSGLLVIEGPSGSGKTWLAEQFAVSLGNSFISQEAATLRGPRFESQLFGHVKGAFSGAVNSYQGLVGAAAGGVLCIEGLDQLDPTDQAAMLRFIQTRAYRPVGSNVERPFEGRLIFTSQYHPRNLLEQDQIRDDLFFRISSMVLSLPGLEQRREDVVPAAMMMIRDIEKMGGEWMRIPTEGEVRELGGMDFSGHFHGLRNLLQRAMIGGLAPAELAETSQTPQKNGLSLPDTGSLKSDLHIMEKQLLERALTSVDSRKQLSARLGISMRSLMYKLKEHGLSEKSQDHTHEDSAPDR